MTEIKKTQRERERVRESVNNVNRLHDGHIEHKVNEKITSTHDVRNNYQPESRMIRSNDGSLAGRMEKNHRN